MTNGLFVKELIDQLHKHDPNQLTNIGEVRYINSPDGTRVRLMNTTELEAEWQTRDTPTLPIRSGFHK